VGTCLHIFLLICICLSVCLSCARARARSPSLSFSLSPTPLRPPSPPPLLARSRACSVNPIYTYHKQNKICLSIYVSWVNPRLASHPLPPSPASLSRCASPLTYAYTNDDDCIPPRDTSPHQDSTGQPPAAHRRRHNRPNHRRHGEHSPTARQPHSNGLCSPPEGGPRPRVCTHIHTYIHISISLCAFSLKYIYTYAHIHTYIYIYIYIYICISMRRFSHICMSDTQMQF